jgi:tetratricopeptide (TPR) repeat protein
VTAVQANDRAVQLFRAGRLDEAIAELRESLEGYAQYATGHSNLGFLYLWKGDLDRAVISLLRALELDPHHKEATDHLMDTLRVLTDELVQIGLTEGFLSTEPGGLFDDHNRHRRARTIGTLVARMGERGVFNVDGRVLEREHLMRFVIKDVEKKMGHHRASVALTFVWGGIGGWHPAVAVPLPP